MNDNLLADGLNKTTHGDYRFVVVMKFKSGSTNTYRINAVDSLRQVLHTVVACIAGLDYAILRDYGVTPNKSIDLIKTSGELTSWLKK